MSDVLTSYSSQYVEGSIATLAREAATLATPIFEGTPLSDVDFADVLMRDWGLLRYGALAAIDYVTARKAAHSTDLNVILQFADDQYDLYGASALEWPNYMTTDILRVFLRLKK